MMFLDMAQCMHWHNDVIGQIEAEHHQEDRCPIGYRHPKSCAEKEGYSTTGDQKCKRLLFIFGVFPIFYAKCSRSEFEDFSGIC